MASPIDSSSNASRPLLGGSDRGTYGSSEGAAPISVSPAVLARMIQIAAAQMAAPPNPRPLGTDRAMAAAPGYSVSTGWAGAGSAGAAAQKTIPIPRTGDIPDGQYVGEMQDSRPHGRGTATYQRHPERRNWKRYEGEWQNGRFHGRGALTFRQGAQYNGEWQAGQLHGRATVFKADQYQTRYEGEYVRGEKQGNGKQTKANGEIYDGEWRDDTFHGRGSHTDWFGDMYEGGFAGGIACGRGTKTWTNGDTYEGEWRGGLQHGTGTMKKVNTQMAGIWREGKLWSGTRGEYRAVDGVLWLGDKKLDGQTLKSYTCCGVQ